MQFGKDVLLSFTYKVSNKQLYLHILFVTKTTTILKYKLMKTTITYVRLSSFGHAID